MPLDPRKKTWEIAQTDPAAASRFAAAIPDEWYRSQALAMVAWHTKSKPSFLRIVKEALTAAKKLPGPNRRVSCSAWIIRAIARRGNIDLAETVQESLLDIEKEENPVRRADALFLVYEAVFSVVDVREMVFASLWRSISEMKSWKKDRLLSNLALTIAVDDVDRAVDITNTIAKLTLRQKTLESIRTEEWLGPHEFFPHYTKPVEARLVR
ncbi:MAG: hypothetical protein IPO41_08485 [Acidobacteria bacterium]|nr:hypothetical protein [Acidobacteriota bacterium]MBK9528343.1 hypothetical protein [Acidobacteriota bacterium]